jgi:hypothetical protein
MGAEVKVDDDGNMEVIDVSPEPQKRLTDGVEAAPAPRADAEEPQRPAAPNGVQNAAPKPASQPIAPTAPTSASGVSSAQAEFFPDEPPGDLGAADKLPRDVEGLPVLGTLNMKALGKQAQDEKLVKGQRHFANLIDLLFRTGEIRAASKPEAVMEAMRRHEAAKDAEKEGVGK